MSDSVSVSAMGGKSVIKIGKLQITVEGDTVTITGKKVRVVGNNIVLDEPAKLNELPPPTFGAAVKRILKI